MLRSPPKSPNMSKTIEAGGYLTPKVSDHDAASAFVDSIFGRQDKKSGEKGKRKSNQQLRRVQKSSSAVYRKLPTRSDHEGLSIDEIAAFELDKMYRAECRQKLVDRFWGLDKESSDCAIERIMMELEHQHSQALELYHKTILLRTRWEEEEKVQSFKSAYEAALREGNARKLYMKNLFSATSSADIIYYDWPTKPHISSDGEDVKNSSHPNNKNDNARLLVESLINQENSDFDIVNLNEESSTIHLGGQQQSRYISGMGGNKNHQSSQSPLRTKESKNVSDTMLRSRSHATVADLAMRPIVLHKPKSAGSKSRYRTSKTFNTQITLMSNSAPRSAFDSSLVNTNIISVPPTFTQQQQQQQQQHNNLTVTDDGNNGGDNTLPETVESPKKNNYYQLPETKPKYVEAIDGHPKYKWDQVLILRQVFTLLDINGINRIHPSTLLHISDNSQILELLRFTVFSSWIKNKLWDNFPAMFDEDKISISLLDFVQGAREIAKETNVPLNFIRTMEEHQEICSAVALCSNQHNNNNNTNNQQEDESTKMKKLFARLARDQHHIISRNYYLQRVLGQGDCIWALRDGSCTWLPAVIEYIDEEKNTLDLSFPLTLGALHEAKVLASSRQLLALPSQPLEDAINPKSFHTERSVCEYLFDSIDEYKTGVVESQELRTVLQSSRYSKIVKTSLALSLLVYGCERFTLQENGSFLDLFINENEVDGKVSKLYFVEYCVALVDVYE